MMFVAENMSEEMRTLSGNDAQLYGDPLQSQQPEIIDDDEDVGLIGNSLQSQEQEITAGDDDVPLPGGSLQSQEHAITVENNPPNMSMNELLEVIRGANGMPVLFVLSSDGRLAAVAVDGLQNLVSDEKNKHDFRSWLLLLASLSATISFNAGLNPPGGFQSTDDMQKKYMAGTPIMRENFFTRYSIFYTSNMTAFFCSLMIIGVLAKDINNKHATRLRNLYFPPLVAGCILSLGTSYISGTWLNRNAGISNVVTFVLILAYMCLPLVINWIASIRRHAPELIARSRSQRTHRQE